MDERIVMSQSYRRSASANKLQYYRATEDQRIMGLAGGDGRHHDHIEG